MAVLFTLHVCLVARQLRTPEPIERKRKIYTVAVNFLSQVIFVFLLFLDLVMNTNEVKAKEKKIPDLKSSLQLIYGQREITRRSSRVRVKRDAKV